MPTCLKIAKLHTGVRPVFISDPATGGASAVEAQVYVIDAASSDLAGCSAVSISGSEYQAIQLAIANQSPSVGGAVDAGVPSNVFMGAALVAIVAIGWIAGAQR